MVEKTIPNPDSSEPPAESQPEIFEIIKPSPEASEQAKVKPVTHRTIRPGERRIQQDDKDSNK